MIFILSDDSTIHCIKSLDELEKIYLKKEEGGYKMIFEGIGKKTINGKELVINLGQVEWDFAWKLLQNVVLQTLSGVNLTGKPEAERTIWPNAQGHTFIQLM